MSIVKLGADPEGFLMYNGEFISAHDILPGSKTVPFAVERGAVQVDGVAVEFNIDPAENEDQFHQNISCVVSQIDEMVKKVDKGISISWTPVAKFRKDIWDKIPGECKVLGCDPDYNTDGEVNNNPTDTLLDAPIRTAAGHVHIGFTEVNDPMESAHFGDCLYIAQGFRTANLHSFRANSINEMERLKYYGHSGSFRPKKYGIELRSPSNWYVGNEAGRRQIFREARAQFQQLTGL